MKNNIWPSWKIVSLLDLRTNQKPPVVFSAIFLCKNADVFSQLFCFVFCFCSVLFFGHQEQNNRTTEQELLMPLRAFIKENEPQGHQKYWMNLVMWVFPPAWIQRRDARDSPPTGWVCYGLQGAMVVLKRLIFSWKKTNTLPAHYHQFSIYFQ